VVVDTSEVVAEERFAFWAQTSAEIFEPLDLRAPRTATFSARLARHELGPLAVDEMAADASVATRTPDAIRRQDPEHLSLMLQLRGECFIAQDDRDSVLRPGDLTVWHSSHPFRVGGDAAFEVLMVRVPHGLLGSQSRRLGRATALRVAAAGPIAGVLRPYLVGLAAGLGAGAFDPVARGHLACGLLDLLPMLSGWTPAPSSRSDDLRARLHAYIDAHLFDPHLTPDRVARAHFVSRSRLDRLFADGPGVQATIRRRRLERCRRDLADPALAHLSVLDIATRWGFASASHFSHAFRAAFGLSPREFRAIARRESEQLGRVIGRPDARSGPRA
jgi:AraC-like DNA-binding protein